MSCPTTEHLTAALRWPGSAEEEADLAAHLAECGDCRARLEELAGGSSWVETRAKAHATSAESALLKEVVKTLETSGGDLDGDEPDAPNLGFLEQSDEPGTLGGFGRYKVLEHVASGGMGIVLKAQDPKLNRIVAIKILHPALAANSLSRARFVREARAAAAVVHENVVPIYAVDEHAGLPYLVMQFVHGRSLAERIRASGPLRLEEILRIGAQTAAGLSAAHAQGLVHRDVKPGNILLENSVERVKLTDFGLARAADEVGLTRTGELAGTPEFMAPEQAGNEPVDHRTDLFSLGSVLYAMCTGRSPFQGKSVVAIIRSVCDEHPARVNSVKPAVPEWLADIIERLMAKAPADRFQSAREVRELLELYLARVQRGELRAVPGSESMRQTVFWRSVAIGAALTSIVFAVLVFAMKKQPPEQPVPGVEGFVEPFVVRSANGEIIGRFLQVEDAIEAAPAGAALDLCWNGAREMLPLKLPSRPLTIRAGTGFSPTWITTNRQASTFSASAPLRLENLRLVLEIPAQSGGRVNPGEGGAASPRRPRVPPSGVAIISITNAPLNITRCVLDVRLRGSLELSAIALRNCPELHLENTFLFGRLGKGIVWQADDSPAVAQKTKLFVTNSILFAGEGLWVDLKESSSAVAEIVRSTLYGPMAIYLPPSLTTGDLEINSRRSLFDTRLIILDGRNVPEHRMPEWVRWGERENLYSPARHYIAGRPPNDFGPSTLSEWNEFWKQSKTGSRHGLLVYANGMSDADARAPGFSEPSDLSIAKVDILDGGPAIPREEYSHFGADTSSVGPASAR